jgi:hypothetical protein
VEPWFRLVFNSTPFPYGANPSTFVARERIVFDDVSEASLAYMLANKATGKAK